MQRLNEVMTFIAGALECSVYAAPTNYGLTEAELLEVGRQLGFEKGEIFQVLPAVSGNRAWGSGRIPPKPRGDWGDFHWQEEPDFRSFDAFEFVIASLQDLVRREGPDAAVLDRSVMIQRAAVAGIKHLDIEVALAVLTLCGRLADDPMTVRFAGRGISYAAPSSQRSAGTNIRRAVQTPASAMRAKVMPVVKDTIARRSDGRPASVNALDAFGEQLDKLGYGNFRMWWTQTVAEVRRLQPSLSPVATAVLAAALSEGALTFVVRHARSLKIGFASSDFSGDPSSWKFLKLVKSAASGETPIFDADAQARAIALNKVRQRIHAGGMLSVHPSGPPDLRPEEATDAVLTAELLVRRVLDWLAVHPAEVYSGTST